MAERSERAVYLLATLDTKGHEAAYLRELFDEPVTALTLTGIAMTALGVGLVVREPRPRHKFP